MLNMVGRRSTSIFSSRAGGEGEASSPRLHLGEMEERVERAGKLACRFDVLVGPGVVAQTLAVERVAPCCYCLL